ncbi:TetR/AcrR family transcriptional regulator [Gordonia rhizosphera]|uniref:Putative TetR family transcriptional regulator n=1 Tax=Gordonia rhizosphera NBRC 16068 TaxID=1108045 RepID=K6X3P6_9ACTN|nr:TetR/AcrR family transcriptional regulator [Gordonia rhizosphera]GAB93419.1 putative TetR family transcriptional regulator [Gordonia rhizosphera NBRC 16068]
MTTEAVRRRDADRTKANIVAVATKEFANKGYAGARVDEIAAKTHTTKRMIYYYYGDKDGLYQAVLEASYGKIRRLEQRVSHVEDDPVTAIRRLAEITFDHHDRNPDFIRIVAGENILKGVHIKNATSVQELGSPAVDILGRILEVGRARGLFRDDVDALDIHLVISSFCFFRVANRYTFKTLFGRDLTAADQRATQRKMLGDMVVAYLTDLDHAADPD